MKALQVQKWGEDPQFTSSAQAPAEPAADSDSVQIKVLAAGLPQLVRSQASGKHYSVKDVPLPYIPGADGIGHRTDTNELVYFISFQTGGGFAELINVPKASSFLISGAVQENSKELAVKIAGLMNPAMSSWMAMHTRVHDFEGLCSKPGGFNVMIIGATTMSGKLAAKFCRSLGASKVFGAGRRQAELDKLGLDGTVVLKETIEETDWKAIAMTTKIDLVLDYVYGDALTGLLNALPSTPSRAHELATQIVSIGAMSQQDLALPSATLRSKNVSLSGAGPGSWSLRQLQTQLPALLKMLVDIKLEDIGTVVEAKYEDVGKVWNDKSARVVFVS